jgi:L-alanine-DL-glutamate epimerase-like enolase superfamily enzyme
MAPRPFSVSRHQVIMATTIQSYELIKLRVPMGRVIGDCGCRYDAMAVVALCLRTNHGHIGWGFGEVPWGGTFARGADWIKPMPVLPDIVAQFDSVCWPLLRGKPLDALEAQRPALAGGYLEQAVGIALWDLFALDAGLPLWKYLLKETGGAIVAGAIVAGADGSRGVRAYGSGLEFNSTDAEAAAIHTRFVRSGLGAVKVKVGHPDIEWDVRRLRAVRNAIGNEVELAIDANEGWDCDEAIRRILRFQDEHLDLSYVEDPLPRTDVAGAARLRREIPIDLAGHDYISDPQALRPFLDAGALQRIRVGGDIDHALAAAKLAREYRLPLIFGNSFCELNVHAAVAFSALSELSGLVDRFEFSDLAWNALPAQPVIVRDGFAHAPHVPGHGLAPDPGQLAQMNHPGPSDPPIIDA